MPFDIESFKVVYKRWVDEGLADFQAGKVLEVVKRYPLVVSEDVPWTSYTDSVPADDRPHRQQAVGFILKEASLRLTRPPSTGIHRFERSQELPGRRTSPLPTLITITALPRRIST